MLRFRLSGTQLFFLVALTLLVALMTFGTGLLYGVRAADRELAAKALDVAPADAQATGPGAGGATVNRNGTPQLIYEVQLSSHLRQEETNPVVDMLLAAGYQAYVVETRDSSNRSLYTVRIGPWTDIGEAAEAAQAFRDHSGLEGLDPKIRHRPKPAKPGAALSPLSTTGGDEAARGAP